MYVAAKLQACGISWLSPIELQPCNPAVGGPAKSQLVHEVDALGGEIGRMADRCYLQKRVLNASKVRCQAPVLGCRGTCRVVCQRGTDTQW